MDRFLFAGLVSLACVAIGSYFYAKAFLAQTSRPTLPTWIVLTLVDIVILVGSLGAKAGYSVALPFGFAFCNIFILSLLVWKKDYSWDWQPQQIVCVCLSVHGLAMALIWPELSVICFIVVNFSGCIQTYVTVYKEPYHENLTAWCWWWLSGLASVAAIKNWTIGDAAFPVYCLVGCTFLIGFIIWRRKVLDAVVLA